MATEFEIEFNEDCYDIGIVDIRCYGGSPIEINGEILNPEIEEWLDEHEAIYTLFPEPFTDPKVPPYLLTIENVDHVLDKLATMNGWEYAIIFQDDDIDGICDILDDNNYIFSIDYAKDTNMFMRWIYVKDISMVTAIKIYHPNCIVKEIEQDK